jgi:hypothetical protein
VIDQWYLGFVHPLEELVLSLELLELGLELVDDASEALLVVLELAVLGPAEKRVSGCSQRYARCDRSDCDQQQRT